jgi:dTMP kinase
VKSGTLVAFEGLDGSGKTTQVAALARALRARGLDVVVTREPTDGAWGRRIRAMAASAEHPDRDEELRWFVEDRREHVKAVIAPALAAGRVVLTDRYFLSTVAYQGARGHDPARLLRESEAEFPRPDLAILLELEPGAGLARVGRRGAAPEPAFEERSFLERVAAIFRSVDRPWLVRIDASAAPEVVEERVRAAVERVLARSRGDGAGRPPGS